MIPSGSPSPGAAGSAAPLPPDAPPVRDFARLWRDRSAAAVGRPFLTCYDAGGGRIELSYPTFGNWLAKTANLLQDDVAVETGDRVALALPPQWGTAVWAVAPLLVGATVEVWDGAADWGGFSRAGAAAVAPEPTAVAAGAACDGERYVVSQDPLGRPVDQVPVGYLDFTTEVRRHGDRFSAYAPPAADTPALVLGDQVLTQRELIEVALDEAAATREDATPTHSGVTAPYRCLVDARADRFSASDLVRWLYAPLVAGGAVVLVRGADETDLKRIAAAERTTALVTLT